MDDFADGVPVHPGVYECEFEDGRILLVEVGNDGTLWHDGSVIETRGIVRHRMLGGGVP